MNSPMDAVKNRDPHEREFHQAVGEVLESVKPVLERSPAYRQAKIVERLVEPERVILFRVPWMDDRGQVQVNRGFRIEIGEIESQLLKYEEKKRAHRHKRLFA